MGRSGSSQPYDNRELVVNDESKDGLNSYTIDDDHGAQSALELVQMVI